MNLPLITSSKPLTHIDEHYGQGKLTRRMVSHYREHPDELGNAVLDGFEKYRVIVLGIVKEAPRGEN